MNTLICAGGSGVRVLEAILHLCAAGLGPKELRLLLVDPDGSNGNSERTKGLLASYLDCRERFGEIAPDLNFFGTKLDLLDPEDGPQTGQILKNWSPIASGKKLEDLINYDNLKGTSRDIAHLLFTKEERIAELDAGFLGHPAIGAAAMSLVSLYLNREPWATLIKKLKNDIAKIEGSHVVLIGSVFGGTGASAIHPIVRFLRDVFENELNKDRLKVAIVALVPYFGFLPGEAEAKVEEQIAARSSRFPLATRAAVEYYEHLHKNQDWPFDCLYWIGDRDLRDVNPSKGGKKQTNPAHFAELLAGIASLEFCKQPLADRSCHYSGPRRNVNPELEDRNLLAWDDIPLSHFNRNELRRKLLQFFIAGIAHLGFCDELLRDRQIDQRPYCVPWYLERFARKEDWFSSEKNQKSLDAITLFFGHYFLPWWKQVHMEGTIRLFNREAIGEMNSDGICAPRLDRLANLLWPDRSGEASLDSFDGFFTEMVKIPKTKGGPRGGAAYLSLLAYAADSYIRRNYLKSAEKEASHA